MSRIVVLLVLLLLPPSRAALAQIQPEGANPPSPPPSQPAPGAPSEPPLQPAEAEDVIQSEIYVGDKAPDFQLDGTGGQTVRLADLEGRWAVLVFDDSRVRLAALKAIVPEVHQLGARLYGVTRDGWEALRSYSTRQQIPFPLLSDLTGQVSELYGMYDEDEDQIVPGVVLVDPKGIVRLILTGQSLHGNEVLQLARHAIAGA